jgi:hypothetical protein
MLCAAAIVYGRAYAAPDDNRAVDLALCHGMPCLDGITPGHTSWTEAQTIFAEVEGSQLLERRIVFHLERDASAELYPSVDGVNVGRMYVTFSDEHPLAAGWLVQRYGRPCGVSLYYNFRQRSVTLRYPFLLANILMEDNRIHSHAPITNIQFSDPAFKSETQPNPCIDNITTGGTANRSWEGFTTLNEYLRRRLKSWQMHPDTSDNV